MNKFTLTTPQRTSTFWRLFFTLGGFVFINALFYFLLYTREAFDNAWIPISIALVALAAGLLVNFMVKPAQRIVAEVSLVVAFAAAYLGGEVVWNGLTIYHAVGGSLLILLCGSLLFLRKWWVWGSILLVYLAAFLAINQYEPVVRTNQNTIPAVLPYTIIISLFLVAVMFFQLLLEFPIRTIRVRLIGTNILLVVIPVALTGIVAMFLNAQSSQQAVIRQLSLISASKESALRSWLNSVQLDLTTIASSFIQTNQVTILLEKPDSASDPYYLDLYQRLEQQISGHIQNTGLFTEILIANTDGSVIFSTGEGRLDANIKAEAYFNPGLVSGMITAPITREGEGTLAFAAQPVLGEDGKTIAVLAGRMNLEPLNKIMVERVGLGDTGETYLVNSGHYLITDSLFEGFTAGKSHVFSPSIDKVLYQKEAGNGSGSYSGYRVSPVIGVYRWIDDFGVALMAEQEQSEALRSTYQGILINLGLMTAAVLAALVIGLLAANRITSPLSRLSRTAEQITSGNLQLMAETEDLDEISTLTKSFNSMTRQLTNLVSGLEQRVSDRTRDLERRSSQLRIAADVAREASAAHDLEELLRRGVNLIHDRFDYYHVGIFLVDEPGEYAVLAAATGEAGRAMLSRGHRLKVGETGMVGYTAQTAKVRISLDVTADPVHYVNPLLPETKSEATLPLVVGGQVIGIVDVQSKEAGLFDEETISVLQIVTDQLAIAIQNARLIGDLAQNVGELQRMYGGYTQASWRKFQQENLAGRGYRFRHLEVEPLVEATPLAQEAIQTGKPLYKLNELGLQDVETRANPASLAVPIRVRGQSIGAIQVELTEASVTPEIISIYAEIADRMALILENARLLQDAQSMAHREQQINILSSQIRNSINLDTILQNTVRELGKAFGTARAFIQIGVSSDAEQDGTR